MQFGFFLFFLFVTFRSNLTILVVCSYVALGVVHVGVLLGSDGQQQGEDEQESGKQEELDPLHYKFILKSYHVALLLAT